MILSSLTLAVLLLSTAPPAAWLNSDLPLEERAASLAKAVPRDAIAAQLACGNFGCRVPIPALNVSAFDWSGEACHGLRGRESTPAAVKARGVRTRPVCVVQACSSAVSAATRRARRRATCSARARRRCSRR